MPMTAALERAAARAARAGWRSCARRRGAVRGARVPDRPGRGVALHERRADCRASCGRARRRRRSRGAARHVPLCRRAASRWCSSTAGSSPALSRTAGLPEGVRIGSLAPALATTPTIVSGYFGQLAEIGRARLRRAEHRLRRRTARTSTSPTASILEAPIQLLFVSVVRSGGSRRWRTRGPC